MKTRHVNLTVLSLFDFSGVFVRPWADAGYSCICVDIQHPEGETRAGNIVRIGIDICDYLPPPAAYAFVAAFPPCTHLAVSGARWFRGKGLGRLAESIRLFYKAAQIAQWSGAPYLLENPVSTISSYWRKPDHTFDPCDYGDLYTKKTCLWTGNGFIMPPKNRIEPVEGSKMHLMPPSVSRANLRSETPRGFSEAVFKANRPSELKSVWLMNHKGEMQG
jgi:hypothetical protein